MLRRVFCKLLLVAIVIFSLLALSDAVMAQGRSEEALEHVRDVQERNTERLMAMNGVEGTAIGYNQNGQLVVKVLTARPGVPGIAKKIDGVPVEVVVTGKIVALSDPHPPLWFPRPVPIGVSTGNVGECSAGTIGCRVKDASGNVYALSNNHVYALENTASDNSTILQPGRYDAVPQCEIYLDDEIGTLADFEPIVFSRRAKNEIDAAIALTNTDLVGTATPAGGYGTPNSEIAPASVDMAVQKYGRTTGLTSGVITAINATVKVGYSRGVARFVGQIIIEPGGFSDGGDSGSLIVTNDESCNPVGLLFAGSSTHTIANPIGLVLARFNVTVDNTTAGEAPVLTTIEVLPESVTLNEGETQQFTATGKDQYGDPIETGTITWASGNTNVGTISEGVFTATGAGTTTVSATSGGVSGTASVTVEEAQAGDVVTITKAEYKRRNGELNVEATSTGAPDAVLTVYDSTDAVNYGQMTYDSRKDKYKLKKRGVTNPGEFVMVISNLGGSATKTVKPK